jgi:Na+/H+ antiporter NhaD/arsenite permease-like protein
MLYEGVYKMEYHVAVAVTVFVIAYIIISLELINRAITTLLAGSFIIALGVLPVDVAYSKIDMKVILLLIAMMIIVSIMRDTGLFQYIAIKTAKFAKGDPLRIIVLLMVITGLISTVLNNVTTMLVLAPLSILIAVELGISPVPFLVTQAIASNIGGTATLIGDPPNIMIGYSVGLSFNDFLINLGPLILVIMGAGAGITILIFRKELIVHNERRARIMEFDESQSITDRSYFYKASAILGLVILGFILYDYIKVDPSVVALLGATFLLLISNKKPDAYFAEVEWVTIFFFIGLFIMVGALEETGIIRFLGNKLAYFAEGNLSLASFIIIWGSGILSGFIDNIPFVATMIPLIKIMNSHFGAAAGNILWWSLSTGACLGGNLTLIGAAANVSTADIAARNGYPISFWEFTKFGIIYTIMALIITSIYIWLRYLM